MYNYIKLLLIEDNHDHAELIKYSLNELENFDFFHVDYLSKAKEILYNHEINLILTDVNLPDGNGVEFLSKNGYLDKIPSLVMTSFGDEKSAVKAMKAGMLDYVIKSEDSLINMSQIIKKALREIEAINKKNEAEIALKVSESRLKNVINLIPQFIYALNKDGRFILSNSAFSKAVGEDNNSIINKKITDVLNHYTNDFEEEFNLIIENGKKILINEEVFYNKKGKLKYLQTTKIPFNFISTENDAILTISQDITEKKLADEELQRIAKLDSLGTLAGGIAHNFNNILAAISINIDLIQLNPANSNAYLEKLKLLVLQATALSTRFQTFSRGGEPIKKSSDIRIILEETESIALSGSDIQAILKFEENLQNVDVDPRQINEVFMNLLINAKQAMPNGGKIFISAENVKIQENDLPNLSAGNYILVTVEDQGIGIPEEVISEIFDPFFTTKENGNGLGLASVHFIIKKHNGFIKVKSEVGIGTTFLIYLPVSKISFEENDNKNEKIKHGKNKKVLIMDDMDEVREAVIILGNVINYRMFGAKNGEEAINLYREAINQDDPFAAVILDLTIMGGMGGEETIKELLKIDPQVRAIVFSGHSQKPIMANFENYGFMAKLQKPVTASSLANCLKSVLSNK